MKYAVGALIAGVAIVLSFQNCKKNISNEQSVESSSVLKIDLSQEKPTHAVLYFNETLTMQRASGSYQVISRSSLKIDLAGGRIEKTSEAATQPEIFCLSNEKLSELNSILGNSQICKAQHEVNPQVMCTMQYTYPYAMIITSREQFELGMAESGCPKETIDLCDGQDVTLKSFAESLENSYRQMDCPY